MILNKSDSVNLRSVGVGANLKSEGVGTAEVIASDNKLLKLDEVICAANLLENLLSLRTFTDLGLCVYFDNKQIDIYNPISKEWFLSDIYKNDIG